MSKNKTLKGWMITGTMILMTLVFLKFILWGKDVFGPTIGV
jgi:hypothetical protein